MFSSSRFLFLFSILATGGTVHSFSFGDTGLGRVTREDWGASFAQPNATGRASFPGFNVSSPYPGSRSDNWTFTIKVRDGLPLDGSGDLVATGTWIQLEAPENLLVDTRNGSAVPQHSSWWMCQGIYLVARLKSDQEVVSGGCDGILPTECISELKRSLSAGFGAREYRCPRMDLPPACEEAFGEGESPGYYALSAGAYTLRLVPINRDILTLRNITNPYPFLPGFRTENTISSENAIFDFARFSSPMPPPVIPESHMPGNFTTYDSAIRQVYVLSHVWGYSEELGTATANPPTPETALVCLRVNDFQEGSRRLSAGVSLEVNSHLPWLVAVGVALLGFL